MGLSFSAWIDLGKVFTMATDNEDAASAAARLAAADKTLLWNLSSTSVSELKCLDFYSISLLKFIFVDKLPSLHYHSIWLRKL